MTPVWLVLGAACTFAFGWFVARRRPAEAEIPSGNEEERIRFDAVLESMDAGVIVMDAAGCIVLVNGRGREMLGCDDSAIGNALEQYGVGADLVSLATGDRADAVELSLSRSPERFVQVRVTRADGFSGAVFVLHEITDIKRLEAVRSDFVANVSHELRTPVSVIAANSETLLDGGLDDTEMAREFVSAMHRNAGRISNLVTDLLDLARIEAGTVNLEPKTVDVHVAVNCTLQTLASVAVDKGVTFSNEVPAGLEAWADSDALEQVLLNFIENAVKYGREGGTVYIRSHRTADHVRVDVIDDGVGVAAPHRVRLFERFYRVDKGRSRSDGGTGLGLAIVKHLVNAMGGEVGMEPNFPTGSVFWLTVPAH